MKSEKDTIWDKAKKNQEKMSRFKYDSISINDLHLNCENFRYDPVSYEEDALIKIIEEQGEKLITLAEDILQHGLNPSELTIVKANRNYKNKYDVLEGNRRITAIKLLDNPDLIPDKEDILYKKFKRFAVGFEKEKIEKIYCAVFENENSARHWIKLKHTGQNGGAGIVEWNAQQKQRFDSSEEKKPPNSAMQILDFLKKNDKIDKSLREKLNDLKSSNLERLITDKDVKEKLGIFSKNKELYCNLHPDELIKPLKKIVIDLLDPEFTVKKIYYKCDKIRYLDSFNIKDLPDKSKALVQDWNLSNFVNPQQPANKVILVPRIPITSKNRELIIPRNTLISIPNEPDFKRIQNIFSELKKLNIKRFENSAAITFRVFLELSVDSYIEKKLKHLLNHTNLSLSKKMDFIVSDFEEKKLLKKDQLKPVKVIISSKNNVSSINTLNAFVHNKHIHPNQNDLINNWDNLELFFIKLWESI
jgi:hypothetical protein